MTNRYSTTTYKYTNVNGDEDVSVNTFSNFPDNSNHLEKEFPNDVFNSRKIISSSDFPRGSSSMRDFTNDFGSGVNIGSSKYTQTRTVTTTGPDGVTTTKTITTNDDDGFENFFSDRFKSNSNTFDDSSNLKKYPIRGSPDGSNTSPIINRSTDESTLTANEADRKVIQAVALGDHNAYRNLHKDTKSLQWDSNLAKSSQEWADRLAATDTFNHSSIAGVGENLYMFGTSQDVDFKTACKKASESWYSEIKDYDLKTHKQSGTVGHFTQLVWKGSEKLGVGVSKVRKNGMTKVYVVGRYTPAGNMLSAYKENVKPLK